MGTKALQRSKPPCLMVDRGLRRNVPGMWGSDFQQTCGKDPPPLPCIRRSFTAPGTKAGLTAESGFWVCRFERRAQRERTHSSSAPGMRSKHAIIAGIPCATWDRCITSWSLVPTGGSKLAFIPLSCHCIRCLGTDPFLPVSCEPCPISGSRITCFENGSVKGHSRSLLSGLERVLSPFWAPVFLPVKWGCWLLRSKVLSSKPCAGLLALTWGHRELGTCAACQAREYCVLSSKAGLRYRLLAQHLLSRAPFAVNPTQLRHRAPHCPFAAACMRSARTRIHCSPLWSGPFRNDSGADVCLWSLRHAQGPGSVSPTPVVLFHLFGQRRCLTALSRWAPSQSLKLKMFPAKWSPLGCPQMYD